MAYKDILVHVDDGAACAARLETAAALARDHDAHLTGIYVKTLAELPGYVTAQMPSEVIESQIQALDAAAGKAEEAFAAAVKAAGVASNEWRTGEGDPADVLALHGRYVDLLVLGQRAPDEEPYFDLPDRLILSVGRPVLVVPYAGRHGAPSGAAMVAWDGSRLATRAVNDAIPQLERASKVAVMAVNPDDAEAGHGAIPSADICAHLARHGVKAEAQHVTSDGSVGIGDMLLSRAADEGCDLFVMGAYGHARWRELVLGGVTRHMLDHMTMPVLMSH
jgi:nucleotide-binding universal stress UspA family protein